MGVRVLYLVRHGQYVVDPGHRLAGHLTALGIRQARCTARRLQAIEFDAIYHSDLVRAAETACIIGDALPKVPRRSVSALRELMPPLPRRAGITPRTSEDVAQFRQATPILTKKFLIAPKGNRNRVELIVAHGNVIRYLVRLALKEPVRRWLGFSTNHCGITILVIREQPLSNYLKSYNDLGHLPLSMQSEV